MIYLLRLTCRDTAVRLYTWCTRWLRGAPDDYVAWPTDHFKNCLYTGTTRMVLPWYVSVSSWSKHIMVPVLVPRWLQASFSPL